MYLKTVCVNLFGVAAHGRKIKPAFSSLDEVFHISSAAIKPDNLIWLHLHRSDNECIQMNHLAIWLLNLEDYPSGMRPAAGLILEFAIFDGVDCLVVPGCPVKGFTCIRCVLYQRGILLQADCVFTVVVFAGVIEFRSCKSAVAPEKKRHERIFFTAFLKKWDHELVRAITAVHCSVPELRLQQITGQTVAAEKRMIVMSLIMIVETVRGKLILQLHGNEFFHRTVSSFCVVRYGLLSLHGKHFFISGGKQIFIAAVRTFFLCSK